MLLHEKVWRLRSRATISGNANMWERLRRRLFLSIYELASAKYGFYIPTTARFAAMPVFPHGLQGIFIARGASVGSDCVIFHQVTIGANQLADSKGLGSPTIGDRCYIGAGAKIIGGVKIGNDVRVGANAVVTIDVPDNATVVSTNEIRLSDRPRDNRFYFVGDGGWRYYQGDKSVTAPPEQTRTLKEAFRRSD